MGFADTSVWFCQGICIWSYREVLGFADSNWQEYGKPSELEGKGSKGRGQGRHLATL